MKRNEVKRTIFRAILEGIAAVMSMSLFACMGKVKYLDIDVNDPAVQATIGTVRNYEAEKLLFYGSAAREKKVWTKRNHEWPEPPEEEKTYIDKEKSQSYVFPYTYKGKEYWINASNSPNGNSRHIYKKISNNYLEDCEPKNREMIVGKDKTEEVWQLLEILEAGDNIVKGVTKGKVEQHTKLGID